MAKYRRFQWLALVPVREASRKPPRHAHVRVRARDICGECGAARPWSHLARYGGVCQWCWQTWQGAGQTVEVGG